MSDLTDITAIFQKASDAFGPITAKPRDADLQRLNESLVVCTLSVTLTGTTAGCASGVVLPADVYKVNHAGATFNFMRAARADYDPAIENLSKEDRVSKLRGMEQTWKAGTANQSRIRAVEVGARNLIIANVESTWLQELSVPGTFFTGVSVRAMLDHLEKDGSGLDRPAGVELILGLHKLWEADPRVPQFIINMEEAQKKSVRAQLPITDNMLAAFATFMLLKTNSFPRNRPVWDGKPVGDQRWDAWKEFFKPLQLALERETAASGDAPNMFGTAAAAQRLHNITPGRHPTVNNHGGDAQGIMEMLDGQFDALAAASANSNDALDQLVAATTQQYADIKSALTNLAAATPTAAATPNTSSQTPTNPPATHTALEARITLLQTAVRFKWAKGGFCSTHGHGVGPKHTSASCRDKKPGHVDTATRVNPAGPGKTKNRGWDAWLM